MRGIIQWDGIKKLAHNMKEWMEKFKKEVPNREDKIKYFIESANCL